MRCNFSGYAVVIKRLKIWIKSRIWFFSRKTAMSFKENLLKKIQIDRLTRSVLQSIGTPDSGLKIDKNAMRKLLEMSPYEYQKVRDLDLYVRKSKGPKDRILVLDNELPIYHTTVQDVAMRKSPDIAEMVKIRNIIKILKDADVKISIKQDSVKTIQKECIAQLDLSYTREDIEQIAREGAAALENGYAEGVKESLLLFADLLGYQPPPGAFDIRHHEIFGSLTLKEAGEIIYGPTVIYSLIDNSLKLIDAPISNFDKPGLEFFQRVAAGKEKAPVEGAAIFDYLKRSVPDKAS